MKREVCWLAVLVVGLVAVVGCTGATVAVPEESLADTGAHVTLDECAWEKISESETKTWERMPDDTPPGGFVEVTIVNDLPWDYSVSFDEYSLEEIDSAVPSENTFIAASGSQETGSYTSSFHAYVFKSHTPWEHFGYSASDSIRFEDGYRYRLTFVDGGGYASKTDVGTMPPGNSTPGFGLVPGLCALGVLLILGKRAHR